MSQEMKGSQSPVDTVEAQMLSQPVLEFMFTLADD